jgi:putative PIN family toxin of toxin-antitoxin system
MGTGRVIDRLRAVLDTNIFLSAFLSRNPTSPTKEILQRWQAGEFVLLVSDALVGEVTEKLRERGIPSDLLIEFLTLIARLAEWIVVPEDSVRPVIMEDPDDDHILACAVVGKAEYLVTYDAHFEPLREGYGGIKITKGVPFLRALRGDR